MREQLDPSWAWIGPLARRHLRHLYRTQRATLDRETARQLVSAALLACRASWQFGTDPAYFA